MTSNHAPGLDVEFVQAAGISQADMDEQLVMLSLEQGKYYHLNPVGTRIWSLLGRPVTTARIVDALTREYEVEASQCLREVTTFMGRIIQKGLVRPA